MVGAGRGRAGHVHHRPRHQHRTLATALGLIAVSIIWLGLYGAGTTWLDLQPAYLLYAIGAGAFVPINSVVVAAVPPGRNCVASGTLNVSIQVSGLLGVAIPGAVLSAGLARRHQERSGPVHRRISGGDGRGRDRRRTRGAAAGVGFAVGAARQSVLGGGG
jgi:hypothetical protein